MALITLSQELDPKSFLMLLFICWTCKSLPTHFHGANKVTVDCNLPQDKLIYDRDVQMRPILGREIKSNTAISPNKYLYQTLVTEAWYFKAQP